MSATRFRAVLYTSWHLSIPAVAKTLSTFLTEPHVGAKKGDSVERAKKPFSPEALQQCYADEMNAFVTGSEAGFLGFFSHWGETLAGWRFFFDVKGDPATWCDWVERMAEQLPPYFAYLCPQADYDARHQSLPGRKGISVAEFSEYLPGLYWMTIFGKELTKAIGKKGFDALLDAEVKSLKGGLTSVRFEGPAVLDDYEKRIAMLQKQATRLKPNLFFDPAKTDGYQQVPALRAALGE